MMSADSPNDLYGLDFLSPYDELPVHQTSRPIGIVQNTDSGFDDGYFFSAFSAEHDIFCFIGLRINPNTDIVGGYVGVNRKGIQRTVRFSRTWRQLMDTVVGPYRHTVVEPYRRIRIELGENDSGIELAIDWIGTAPAFLEAHHVATTRGRVTTDQSRYSQPGTAEGWISIDGDRLEVTPGEWYASRDHSWGVYHQRPPLAVDQKWLPPQTKAGRRRALRFWTLFGSDDLSGFYGIHENEDGSQRPMNDTFGTPVEGRLHIGWDQEVHTVVGASHELTLLPGTRRLDCATIFLEVEDGSVWTQHVQPVGQPWVTATMGYQPGSWKDGGSMRTYHGPGVSLEWDEFDFSSQPFDHTMHDGVVTPSLYGKEYLSRITTHAPDGRQWQGAGHTELFLDGAYRPLGLT